jgi:hypothetical protein
MKHIPGKLSQMPELLDSSGALPVKESANFALLPTWLK